MCISRPFYLHCGDQRDQMHYNEQGSSKDKLTTDLYPTRETIFINTGVTTVGKLPDSAWLLFLSVLRACEGQKTTFRSHFSASIMCVLWYQNQVIRLVGGCWAILLAPGLHFYCRRAKPTSIQSRAFWILKLSTLCSFLSQIGYMQHYIAEEDLQLLILLPPPPQGWDYRQVLPRQA